MAASYSTDQLGAFASDAIKVTGSQISYYFICRRKLWLFSHNIELEAESDLVKLGKLLHENRYKRKLKEVQIDRIKIDFMEARSVPTSPLKIQEDVGTTKYTGNYEAHQTRQSISTAPIYTNGSPGPNKDTVSHTSKGSVVEEPVPQKEIVIHEVKRSKKMQDAHLYQLLYYMYYLKKNYNVNVRRGVLHYPLINQKVDALLDEERTRQIEEALLGISKINSLPNPPEATWKRYCRSCAYCDLCWG